MSAQEPKHDWTTHGMTEREMKSRIKAHRAMTIKHANAAKEWEVPKAFLKPEALVEAKVFEIKETEGKGKIKFTIDFNLNDAQKIVLYFDRVSKNLLGWRLYESLNDFIEVKVINYKKFTTDNKSLLKKIFKLTEASSERGMEYFSPYDNRQVKRITKGGRLN